MSVTNDAPVASSALLLQHARSSTVGKEIILHFTNNIAESSVSESSIALPPGMRLAPTNPILVTGNLVILALSDPLLNGSYAIAVAGSIADTAGTALGPAQLQAFLHTSAKSEAYRELRAIIPSGAAERAAQKDPEEALADVRCAIDVLHPLVLDAIQSIGSSAANGDNAHKVAQWMMRSLWELLDRAFTGSDMILGGALDRPNPSLEHQAPLLDPATYLAMESNGSGYRILLDEAGDAGIKARRAIDGLLLCVAVVGIVIQRMSLCSEEYAQGRGIKTLESLKRQLRMVRKDCRESVYDAIKVHFAKL